MYIVHPFLYTVIRCADWNFRPPSKFHSKIFENLYFMMCVCVPLVHYYGVLTASVLNVLANKIDMIEAEMSSQFCCLCFIMPVFFRSLSRKVKREIDKFNTNETNEECITKAKNETESKPNEKKYIQNFLFTTFLSQVVWFVSKLAITETVVVDFNK